MNQNLVITRAVMIDPSLTQAQKLKAISSLNLGNQSIIPPAISSLAVKFNNLHPATQIILSLLGFGLGRYLLDRPTNHGNMINLDKPGNGYIIKQ